MVIFNSYVSLPEGTDDYKMAKVCKWMFVFTSPWEFTGPKLWGAKDLDERDGKITIVEAQTLPSTGSWHRCVFF
jgi:hypothetical protein